MLSILPAEATPEEKNRINPLRQIPHGEPFPTPEDWEVFRKAEAEEDEPLHLIGLPEVTYRVGKAGYNPYADSTMRSIGSALVCARFLMKEATDQVLIVFVVDGAEVSRVPAANLI